MSLLTKVLAFPPRIPTHRRTREWYDYTQRRNLCSFDGANRGSVGSREVAGGKGFLRSPNASHSESEPSLDVGAKFGSLFCCVLSDGGGGRRALRWAVVETRSQYRHARVPRGCFGLDASISACTRGAFARLTLSLLTAVTPLHRGPSF